MKDIIKPGHKDMKFILEVWVRGVLQGTEGIPAGYIQERAEELLEENPDLKKFWTEEPWGYCTMERQGETTYYYQFIFG